MTNITKTNSHHIILRKDVVSNKMYPQNELIRIVKTKDGKVFIDQKKKASGRGVYIAPSLQALKIAQDKNLIQKALKTKIEDQLFKDIEKEINENWD